MDERNGKEKNRGSLFPLPELSHPHAGRRKERYMDETRKILSFWRKSMQRSMGIKDLI